MDIEELKKQVSDLQAEKEAMNAKNKELLAEVKKVKAKNADDCSCPQRGGQQKIKANLKSRINFGAQIAVAGINLSGDGL
jgi:hypothetical protein